MSSLPEEIYLQILLRVPVKSTFVCKCVCKSWFSLVSDPTFAKTHLDLTPNRNDSSINLMVVGSTEEVGPVIYSISYDSSLLKKSVSMCYPYEYLGYSVVILGSSNGLVCLKFYDDSVGSHEGNPEEFFFCVWNPATHEYKRINKPTDKIDWKDICMHAFGYDHKIDDYKLVIGIDFDDDETSSIAVYVYTIESDSWKCRITVPFNFWPVSKYGLLTNGEFHFLAYGREGDFIVSLDISKERFIKMELPVELKVSGHWFITEAVLEGCLCLLAVFGDSRPDDIDADDDRCPPRVEMWVMQDYGVQKSWTKRYIITHDVITCQIRRDLGDFFILSFVSSSKNGEILLNTMGKLILYNPKDGSAVELGMGDAAELFFEASYFESLVSVNSGTYVWEGQPEESTEQEEAA